jgi:hypothetical protein
MIYRGCLRVGCGDLTYTILILMVSCEIALEIILGIFDGILEEDGLEQIIYSVLRSPTVCQPPRPHHMSTIPWLTNRRCQRCPVRQSILRSIPPKPRLAMNISLKLPPVIEVEADNFATDLVSSNSLP